MSKFYTDGRDDFGDAMAAVQRKRELDPCNGDTVSIEKNDSIDKENVSTEEDEGQENVYDSLSASDDDYVDELLVSDDENKNLHQSDIKGDDVVQHKLEKNKTITFQSSADDEYENSDENDVYDDVVYVGKGNDKIIVSQLPASVQENDNDLDKVDKECEDIFNIKPNRNVQVLIQASDSSQEKDVSDDSTEIEGNESEDKNVHNEAVIIRERDEKDGDATARNENPAFFSVLALRPADSRKSPFFKRKDKKQAKLGWHRSGGFRSPSPLPHVPEINKVDPYIQWPRLLTWFLGPKAENEDEFLDLATSAIKRHCRARRCYFRTDPEVITQELKQEVSYKTGIEQQKKELERVSLMLEQSVPTFSPRYQGHMLWDTCMPANLGYLQAFLYNQNNVALEASPVTSKLEVEVGKQICKMIYGTCKQIERQNKNSPAEESDIKPWGHMVSGGSLANIESLWAARNTKFVPLALRKVITDDPELKGAKEFMVYIARKGRKNRLLDSSTWDLLNLDLDEVIKMPLEVAKMADCTESYVMSAIQKYSVTQLGMYGLLKKFGVKKTPVVITPATNHYSWPKAANVLGMGIGNLRQVGVDERCRMDMDDLERVLQECEETKTPVLTVVAVIGTTEESAVDPLSEILELKETMKKKGLTFTVNADAAWGGYFMTMLTKQNTVMEKKESPSYVPACSLSVHTIRQLEKLHKADTITIDPHKSGFVPYSAGFLCFRNGEMKKFVKMEATVIAHEGEEDTGIGICSLEGSRPGAAAAGVLMAHNTIGLNNDGYGRILGQCTFGAKLFYCRWLTLAKDDDNFVIVPMKSIPKDFDINETKKVINTSIFGEDVRNENILKSSSVRRILRYIGPDMLITAFAVNIIGNHDVEKCNKLNKLIFNMLSHSGQHAHVRRVPLILTQSEVSPNTAPKVVKQFKERLGLFARTPDNVHFLINTVMNPWVGTSRVIASLGDIFRQTVITAIGTVTDPKDAHCFVCVGKLHGKDKDEIFAELVPSFTSKSHQYQAVVKFQLCGDVPDDISSYQEIQPMFVKTLKKMTLGQLIQYGNSFEVDIEVPKSQKSKAAPILTPIRQTVKVIDVPLFNHFDLTRKLYHTNMTYFLYGNDEGAYMTHMISRAPDFFQVLAIDSGYPPDVDDDLLHQGIMVEIDNLPGLPINETGTKNIVDPLPEAAYKIKFTGDNNTSKTTTIRLTNPLAKTMFKHLTDTT